jgi:hypothetical protein
MNEVTYRLAEPRDYPRINEFYNRYYQIGRTVEQFVWEFVNCPAGPGIYTMAVDDSDKILGIQAGIPVTMIKSGGQSFLTVKSEDSLIDIDECSKYRRKDIFKELYYFFIDQCRQRNVRLIWGFTHALNTLKRIGFEIPFHTGQFVLVLNPLMAYKALCELNPRNASKDKIKIGLLSFISFLNGARRYFSPGSRLSFKEGTSSNVKLFYDMISPDDQVVFIKEDESYLSWRTEQNPYRISYKVYNFFDNNVMIAQVITSKIPGGSAFIEQMVFSRGVSGSEKRAILRKTILLIQKEGAHLIRFMAFGSNCFHQNDNRLLKETGFLYINRGIGFMFMNISGEDTFIRPDNIYLSRLYTQGQG